MGMNANLYLGVFLQVGETTRTVKLETYTHPKTGKGMSTRFDPVDGSEGILKVNEVPEVVKPDSYIEEFDDDPDYSEDDFWTPEFSGAPRGWENFIPGYQPKEWSIRTPDVEQGGTIEFDSEFQIEDMVLKFNEHFKKHINFYKKKYGNDQVIPKFGLIIYWS